MFEYQKTNQYFGQISPGMEDLGVAELANLKAEKVQAARGGISFEADKATLYRLNYQSRLLTRILASLATFRCHETSLLYKKALSIKWSKLFNLDQTFAIYTNISRSKISHSQYAGQVLKDAIVDHFRKRYGKRPNVDSKYPDIRFNLHIYKNIATISFDTSGESLHRRGYRRQAVDAPMQETLAAAIIQLTGWNGETPLYDPMCGSGTLLSEALMKYCQIPPALLRKRFGFELLPDFDERIWQSVKREADSQIVELPEKLISGSDISPNAVAAARENNHFLPNSRQIKWYVLDFQDVTNLEKSTIVCNPPYGIRQKAANIEELYKKIGDFLKQRCKGSTAYIYAGEPELIWKIGLKPSWQKSLRNGPLKGKLAKFVIF